MNCELFRYRNWFFVDSSVFKTALPILLGYLPVAVTFGLLANQQGIGIEMALALSIFVYAGASQFVGLSLLTAGTTAFFSVFVTIWLVNLRHVMLSLAYLPHTRRWTMPERLRFFPFLTDETFAVLISSPDVRTRVRPALQVVILSYLTWIFGTGLGFYSGALIPDPRKMGLDFALPALFIAIVVLFLKNRAHAITLVATLTLSFLFYGVLGGGKNSLLLAALIGSGIGWWSGRFFLEKSEVGAEETQ